MFRNLLFGNAGTTDMVDKIAGDKVPPLIALAYKGRLEANVTDSFASITFLRVNRNDSTTYTLTIKTNDGGAVKSEIGILVTCKYKKTNQTIYTR